MHKRPVYQSSNVGTMARPTKRTFRLINGYCDPQDEKVCDSTGWFQSYRTGAGNARTDPVVERVEAVEVFPLKEDMFTDTV